MHRGKQKCPLCTFLTNKLRRDRLNDYICKDKRTAMAKSKGKILVVDDN